MEDEQEIVAAVLRSMPPPDAGDGPDAFVARVNARIDATSGWFGLADFRTWTLRLAPAAAAFALIGVFWSAPSATESSVTSPETFRPASSIDWQQDVSGDALVEAALTPAEADRAR
jgi:hypothetical protein